MDLEAFREIDLDEAFSFYQDRFADASDFTFLFVGAFQPGEIMPLVEMYLGGLPSIGRNERWVDLGVELPVGVIEKTVRKGLEPQSLTQIVFTGPFESTADTRMGIRTMSSVLESRLLRLVREDMSGTYGVQVSPGYSLIPEPEYQIRIQFGSDPERVEELVGAVFTEIQALIQDGPTPEDVQAAKEKERRSRETNLEENGWWMNQLRSAYFYDWDPHLALDEGPLERVTAETIQGDAGRWLRLDNYVRVSLFPEEGGS
jgi:zinc protease